MSEDSNKDTDSHAYNVLEEDKEKEASPKTTKGTVQDEEKTALDSTEQNGNKENATATESDQISEKDPIDKSTATAEQKTKNSELIESSASPEDEPTRRDSVVDESDLSDSLDFAPEGRRTACSLDVVSIFKSAGTHGGVLADGVNEHFLLELVKLGTPKVIMEQSSRASLKSQKNTPDAAKDAGDWCVRSWYEFSSVMPLHMCTAHSFVCFRDNGDLVAVTPTSVYIYDRPPAACELTYKEPLYSISVSDVFRVADLNDNSILLLRQGSFHISEKRASDELLVAEVGINAVSLLVKIALPQTVVYRTHSGSSSYPVLRERSSQSNSAECRGMQVNKKEHKVYLLYDYHLAVIDLDMRLEPVILRLRCNDVERPLDEQTGPAVALMEFDHAVYILTSKLCLLGTNKIRLFAQDPSSCCMPVVQTLSDWRLLADNEISSYVIDRCNYTAFFSVPNGRKLVSLRLSVPAMLNDSLDFEPADAPLHQNVLIQERLYSDANCKDWAATVPWSLAWDSTTQQLLVLEWGSENNGVLISLDVCLVEEAINGATQSWFGQNAGGIYDRFVIVKTFSSCKKSLLT